MARASGNFVPKPSHLDLDSSDNMFADLKSGNRGSGASNTTKATSTDTSSRHSATSTAPSSTDLAHDDHKHIAKKNLHDPSSRPGSKSSAAGFLNRAGRTFSFGVQKKHNATAPKNNEVPPVPPIHHEDFTRRSRGLTESTTSTATPPKLEGGGSMDMGGDFGSMFTSFDKRASVATVRHDASDAPRSLTNNRGVQPAPLNINKSTKVDPPLQSLDSRTSNDNLLGSNSPSPDHDDDSPPPVPRHQSSFKTVSRPSDIIEDEDAKLLQDSIAAGRLLSDSGPTSISNVPSGRYRRDEDTFSSFGKKPQGSSFRKGDDNLFEGTAAHTSRITNRFTPRAASPPRNKVMTPAQFEKYRQDKLRQTPSAGVQQPSNDDDDEDEINYDDDEDEMEKSKQQTKQRRKQEAHMAVYRQQMMKVTGEQPDMHPPDRPGLPMSASAPQLNLVKSPSPNLPAGVSDEDEDEEVPLAILQAHGFPAKNRGPSRMGNMGSNPNLRATAQLQPGRPGSSMGEASNQRPHSMLPAFARNLPQDPFVGASIAKPAVRESLSFGAGAHNGGLPHSQSQQSLHPGGLVGVIASEERSKAMRRGSPSNMDGQKLIPGMNGAQDPYAQMGGVPQQMMNGMYGMPMPQMAQPSLSAGDQAQIQMTQQMSQFMQMQMQFMQMMAAGGQQPNGGMPQMPPMGGPYMGTPGTQSVNDLSRQSMMFEPSLEPPRRMDASMRTMSMVGPPSGAPFMQQQAGYAGSIHGGGMGYAPSIAPSERSNVGLPGRYRPVSQAFNPVVPDPHRRTNTMSGALSHWNEPKGRSTINVVGAGGDGSDDDDEEGWEAMKAKRDKKRTMWKSKKGYGNEVSAII